MNKKSMQDSIISINNNWEDKCKLAHEEDAFDNFKKLSKKIKHKNILFLLPCSDEIDISKWYEHEILNNKEVYILNRKKIKKYFFIKINDTNFKIEYFKSIPQPIYEKDNSYKDIKFDMIIMPVFLFDTKLRCVDYDMNHNLYFIKKINYDTQIVGYCYNYHRYNSLSNDYEYEVDHIITNSYFLSK